MAFITHADATHPKKNIGLISHGLGHLPPRLGRAQLGVQGYLIGREYSSFTNLRRMI